MKFIMKINNNYYIYYIVVLFKHGVLYRLFSINENTCSKYLFFDIASIPLVADP